MSNPLKTDLEHIFKNTFELWEDFRGKKIFITGGTGFFGCWLLESFLWANEKLNLNATVTVLTRNPAIFALKVPHLSSHSAIQILEGDILSFKYPKGKFSHIIHAATEASAKLNQENPLLMFNTIVDGTKNILDFALHCQAEKFLSTSSGAVYGKQPPEISHVAEDYVGSPDLSNPSSAYGEGKRAAELLCNLYNQQYGIETKIARCFAFVGPYLPLDTHFAIGNFINNGLKGEPILIKGDGTPIRSYLYAGDLIIWLLTILIKGKPYDPINVGSEVAFSIAELANIVSECFEITPKVTIVQKKLANQPRESYLPSVKKALDELNLKQTISLRDAIKKTIDFELIRR